MLSNNKPQPLSSQQPILISRKPELLAPAGNYEKLETAIHYGADAVYLGGKDFSLRNFSSNFTDKELESAVQYSHKHNVKVYVTCNIFSRNSETKEITKFLEQIGNINSDGVIIADPGVILMSKKIIPNIDIHLSTQANTTNLNAVRFWQELGVKRINLARELSLNEIREIVEYSKSHLSPYESPIEIETFVHGAMCISYSGRCLLSSVLTGRDSNRGLCSHPCRWRYAVVEEQRQGEYHPVMEDRRGAYIFNSKDLCMIDHIPELFDAGIDSFKIEGRMKGISYLASVVKTYREAIDSYSEYLTKKNQLEQALSIEMSNLSNSENDCESKNIVEAYSTDLNERWHKELALIYHRTYCTGFYFDNRDQTVPNYTNIHEGSIHSFIGKIIQYLPDNRIVVEIRNRASVGDTVEILPSEGEALKSKIAAIYDINNKSIPHAQPNSKSILELEFPTKTSDLSDKSVEFSYNLLEYALTPLNIVRKVS